MTIAVQMTAAARLGARRDCCASAIDYSRLAGRATTLTFVRSTGDARQWPSD